MHGFFPGVFFFAPVLLFFGFLKIIFFVLLIVLIVRVTTHGRHYAAYANGCSDGHGYGYGHSHGGPHGHGIFDAQNMDPRRIAAWRYASGEIDRNEFDSIMSGLGATAPAAPVAPAAPPSDPTPQA